MKIALCSCGSNYPQQALLSFIDLILWGVKNKIHWIFSFIQGANIYLLRDHALNYQDSKVFNGTDYDYVLWVDSDQSFNGNHLRTLIEADKDIIGSFIKTTSGDYAVWHNGGRIKNADNLKEPLEVDTIGFGFTLIKKGVYEKLKYPYHQPIINKDGSYQSEDDSFCQRAREAGIKIYAHPEVKVGHIKEVILI